jgi:hypothetical protein
MTFTEHLLTVIVCAYLLAGIPIGAAALAGRMSQLHRLSTNYLCCLWSRFALLIVAAAFVSKSLVR